VRPLELRSSRGAAQQGDEADEAFGGTNPRAASGENGRGHRFAAYPRCSADYLSSVR
jgi:hypothetical protein